MKVMIRGKVYDSLEEPVLIQTSKFERDCIHDVPEDTLGIFLAYACLPMAHGQILMDFYKKKEGIEKKGNRTHTDSEGKETKV